jgi:hypothetical protein
MTEQTAKPVIREKWEQFEKEVITTHGPVPDQVLSDMKAIFYAGASALYYSVMGMFNESPEGPTDEHLDRLGGIHAELTAFSDRVTHEYREHEQLKRRKIQ